MPLHNPPQPSSPMLCKPQAFLQFLFSHVSQCLPHANLSPCPCKPFSCARSWQDGPGPPFLNAPHAMQSVFLHTTHPASKPSNISHFSPYFALPCKLFTLLPTLAGISTKSAPNGVKGCLESENMAKNENHVVTLTIECTPGHTPCWSTVDCWSCP